MGITREHALWQLHFAVAAHIAHGDAGNLQANSGAGLNDIGLALNKLNECCANIAAAKHANAND
jgi:hypothetical protein